MTRLILINGAPATGKSTLARRYVEDHPPALDLDIDLVRRLLGGWRSDLEGAGLRARAIALAAARVHLSAGHDVVVPQLIARADFIERLASVAEETGADFREVYLRDGVDSVLRRFAARTAAAEDPTHVEAHETLSGGEAALRAMHAKIEALIPRRPGAITVASAPGDPERTYADLLARLGE